MRKYLGIPYQDHGRSKEGLDCWGLCVMIAKEKYGYVLPNLDHDYTSAADGKSVGTLVEINKLSGWEKVSVYRSGDIVVFNVAGFPCHVGTYIDDDRFIHILNGSHVTIEHLNSITWSKRLNGVYRKCKQR